MFFKKSSILNEKINGCKEASHIVFLVHQELKKHIKVGVSLKTLDKIAYDLIISKDAKPAFLGYQGFPASICASINNVLVHGIPNDYLLKEGDLISIDVGVYKNGYYGDAAFSVGIGKISSRHQELLDTTKLCLNEALKIIKPGIKTGDLGFLIKTIANSKGFSVPKDYVGHGIGKELHEDPMIPNYGSKGQGTELKENMIICVEPMLIDGEDDLYVDPLDNWTVRTKHNGYCSHEEYQILITKDGNEILTK